MDVLRAEKRLAAIFILLVLALGAGSAFANDFPTRSVRVIVPYPPGGPTDVMARALGEGFRERTGQPFVIENRPGGNTAIGAASCKNSPPDGYTICVLPMTAVSLNPHLYGNLSYDPTKDLEPITNIEFSRQVLLMNASVPASSLAEMVQYSKDNPTKLNFASFGVGSESHLIVEWIMKVTGARLTHIPYSGAAPGMLAFERGDVHLFFLVASPAILEKISSGKAKGLLVPGTRRNPSLPDVPTYSEAGLPVLELRNWFGMFAPAGTPKDIVEKLGREIVAVIRSDTYQQRYVRVTNADPVGDSPAEFKAFLEKDRIRAGDLVKFSGIKPLQ
jgi:tripartite-type tricarboxylate transporter receptor subunit TctC